MRWTFVFIILYLIPLIILFKNYKNFKRSCVYGSIYIVLATVIVIFNIYLSNIQIIEQNLNDDKDVALETYFTNEYDKTYTEDNSKNLDLKKVNEFKSKVYDIEKTALIPMRKCVTYTKSTQKSLYSLMEVRNDIVYAKEMCEAVVDEYNNMEIPNLSKEKYTKLIESARIKIKKTYELRLLAMENSLQLVDTKSPIYINKVTEYLKEADKQIEDFEHCLEKLKIKINDE